MVSMVFQSIEEVNEFGYERVTAIFDSSRMLLKNSAAEPHCFNATPAPERKH
jgi:hypothetical protein